MKNNIYYLTTTARRKNAKRHIDSKSTADEITEKSNSGSVKIERPANRTK